MTRIRRRLFSGSPWHCKGDKAAPAVIPTGLRGCSWINWVQSQRDEKRREAVDELFEQHRYGAMCLLAVKERREEKSNRGIQT